MTTTIPPTNISATVDTSPPSYNPPQAQNEKIDTSLPRQPEPAHQMTYSNQSAYPSSVPTTNIKQLESAPAPVQCPICQQTAMTRVDFHSGGYTFGWAALGCIICAVPLACIPFAIDGTKNVDHICGACGKKLATWHRSGRTEVWAYEGVQPDMQTGMSAAMKK